MANCGIEHFITALRDRGGVPTVGLDDREPFNLLRFERFLGLRVRLNRRSSSVCIRFDSGECAWRTRAEDWRRGPLARETDRNLRQNSDGNSVQPRRKCVKEESDEVRNRGDSSPVGIALQSVAEATRTRCRTEKSPLPTRWAGRYRPGVTYLRDGFKCKFRHRWKSNLRWAV
jgi:hypothetical protein